jgi:hypothetical protein
MNRSCTFAWRPVDAIFSSEIYKFIFVRTMF